MRTSELELLLCAAVLSGSCTTTVDPRADYDEARAAIREATAVDGVHHPDEPPMSTAEISAVLADGLTLEEARSLVLRNSRRLQAGFLELGIARADFEQAGLLSNPRLSLAVLLPAGGGRERISAELYQGVTEIWQLPQRQELARADLRERLVDLTQLAAQLVFDVERAYAGIVIAAEARQLAEARVRVARELEGLVRRKSELGVAKTTDVAMASSRALAAELELRQLEQGAALGRQRLAELLALEGDPASIVLSQIAPWPAESADAFTPEELLQQARQRRLDLRAGELAVARADAAVEYERKRTIPEVAVGVEVERPEVGSATDLVIGPGASIELPIFDQNTVQFRRAELARDAARKYLEALRADAEQQVRGALARVGSARAALRFIDERVLPQAVEAERLARATFDIGHATALDLLEAERTLVSARDARREARAVLLWAQLDLERAAGGAPGLKR